MLPRFEPRQNVASLIGYTPHVFNINIAPLFIGLRAGYNTNLTLLINKKVVLENYLRPLFFVMERRLNCEVHHLM